MRAAMMKFLLGWGLMATVVVSFAADPTMSPKTKKSRPELGASAAFAPDGDLYAVTKAGEHVLLHRSRDDGQTWLPPIQVNALGEAISADGENRPKIGFLANGTTLVSWTMPLSKPFTAAIRLARAEVGAPFSPPMTVHRDTAEITHRFESLHVGQAARVMLAWIDKRDLEAHQRSGSAYRGAAIYAALSEDGGRSFAPEFKVADHSCECCRIATASDRDGSPLFLWRHVFAPNERDHALAKIGADGKPENVLRATFDRWKVDGCPHHGPSLAVGADGVRHAVWFNQVNGEGRVFYGRLPQKPGEQVRAQRRVGTSGAVHADLAVSGDSFGERVLIVWKRFDGEVTRLEAEISEDGGEHFRAFELARSESATDQPRIAQKNGRFFVVWHDDRAGLRVFSVK